MPALELHQSAATTKLILLGESGSGKSGSLAALAEAGFNLRIVDLDGGLDVLANVLRDPKGGYSPAALSRVHYETITDPMRNVNGKLIPRAATALQRMCKLLDSWKTETGEFGPITSWGTNDVLCLDSLSTISTAAMNFVLSMNARLGQQPHQSDWYQAQQLVESLLQMLYDDGVKCNVVLIAHLAYIGEDNGPQRGLPAGPGKALSPKIGRYFNSMIMAKAQGTGASAARKLVTNSTNLVELKTSAPTRVKPEYGIKNGLAEFFRDVRGEETVK